MTTGQPMRLEPGTDFIPSKAARVAELRSYRRLIGLARRPVAQPEVSDRVPVVAVPGLLSGDVSLTILSRALRRQGHRTFGSRLGANIGCTDLMVSRLITRLESVVAQEGRPVAVVGHSRGGMVVKLAARRRPDLVTGIVVMAAPLVGSLSVAVHVRKQLEVLFRMNRRGFGAAMAEDCVTGACAARISAELDGPFPSDIVPFTSVYSRSDAVIDWHSCLDPAAELIEVDASHTGMGTDPVVARIVSERVAALTGATPPL